MGRPTTAFIHAGNHLRARTAAEPAAAAAEAAGCSLVSEKTGSSKVCTSPGFTAAVLLPGSVKTGTGNGLTLYDVQPGFTKPWIN